MSQKNIYYDNIHHRAYMFMYHFQKPAPPLIPEMDTKVPYVNDSTFNFMREEGVMFTVPAPGVPASYWVVG